MSSNVFNQKLTFHLLVQIDLSGIQNLEYTVYNIFWEGNYLSEFQPISI